MSTAASINDVFIETQKAVPKTNPVAKIRRALSGAWTSIARARNQSATHKSSVRNSAEVRMKFDHSPARITAQIPARGETRVNAIFQIAQSDATNSGSIANRIQMTISARSPSSRINGEQSNWKSGVWLSKKSR